MKMKWDPVGASWETANVASFKRKIWFCLSRIALTLQWFLRKMSKPPELQYRYRVTSVQTSPPQAGWCLAEPLKCKIVLIICLNWMLVGLRAPQKPDPYRGPLAISLCLSLSPAVSWSLCRWMSIAAKIFAFHCSCKCKRRRLRRVFNFSLHNGKLRKYFD